MKLLDLSLGNPSFLQEKWNQSNFVLENLDMSYKGARKGFNSLTEGIRLLHKKYNNCKISENSHIVITVGASQAVQACLYAQKKIKKSKHVYCPTPYWKRFDDFFEMTGVETAEEENSGFVLRTSPNNPDGVHTDWFCHIRDACYNWPQYGVDPICFKDEMILFSLAKMSGHASTRIGWIVTENEELAKEAQNYVNMATLGVSLESQYVASFIIEQVLKTNFLSENKNILKQRRLLLFKALEASSCKIKILSEQGMFWYIECHQDLLNQLNVTGTNCGENLFRLNIACSSEDFQELTNRIYSL